MKRLIFSALILVAQLPALAADNWQLVSPNKKLVAELKLNESGQLFYRLLASNTELLGWSSLGLKVQSYQTDGVQLVPLVNDWMSGLEFVSRRSQAESERYQLLTGKRLNNHQEYLLHTFTFKADYDIDQLELQFRMYDDGIAFRYHLQGNSDRPVSLNQELSEFNLGNQGQLWAQPYDFVTLYHPSYETEYVNVPLGTPVDSSKGTGWSLPLLVEKSGYWLLIHESGLNDQYHGSHIAPHSPNGVYKLAPPLAGEALGFGKVNATHTLPWTMPWRYIQLSKNLAEIAQSNRVFDLASPNKLNDTSWIKPGRSAWSWYSDHESSKDHRALLKFIDLAAAMNWEYSLVDTDWHTIAKEDFAKVLNRAKEKNIGLMLWYNSGGEHNAIKYGPRNIIDNRLARRAEFQRISELGIKGIKVDFLQSDKQLMMRQYQQILADAAEFKLLVNFHGCTIPRGWQRTWPNLITMEAIRGYEMQTFGPGSGYEKYAAFQATLTPFIRNVVGSMDITPVAFSHQFDERITTDSYEAALPIVFESSVTHFADNATSFLSLPADIKNYFSKIPVVWDDTRILNVTLGEQLIIARLAQGRWYIAAINALDTPVTLEVELPKNMQGKAQLISSDNRGRFQAISEQQLSSKLSIELQAYDGKAWVID